MYVKWEVEDGYVGKSRPQYTYIPDEEIEECETEQEKNYLIEDFVENDFNNNITFFIKGEE